MISPLPGSNSEQQDHGLRQERLRRQGLDARHCWSRRRSRLASRVTCLLEQVGRSPPRSTEDVANALAVRRRRAYVTNDVAELAVADAHGIERVDVLREAVAHATDLLLEGPEQPVPDDEDAAVVLVEVLAVRSVVHAMVRGRVEDEFDRLGQAVDRFGVDPELVEQVELSGAVDLLGRKTEQRQRREDPERHERRPRLA